MVNRCQYDNRLFRVNQKNLFLFYLLSFKKKKYINILKKGWFGGKFFILRGNVHHTAKICGGKNIFLCTYYKIPWFKI